MVIRLLTTCPSTARVCAAALTGCVREVAREIGRDFGRYMGKVPR